MTSWKLTTRINFNRQQPELILTFLTDDHKKLSPCSPLKDKSPFL